MKINNLVLAGKSIIFTISDIKNVYNGDKKWGSWLAGYKNTV